jgi:hypothetical protein
LSAYKERAFKYEDKVKKKEKENAAITSKVYKE